MTSQTLAGDTRSLGYDAASRLLSLDDSRHDLGFAYDVSDRLTNATSTSVPGGAALPSSQSFSYDLNGNRLNLTEGGTNYTYSYDGTTKRLTSTSGPIARGYTYDAAGNALSDGQHSYTYDDRGRLVSVDGGAATYQHNGQGQRVFKDAGTPIRFAYDEAGQLVGEYDANGSAIQETVWFQGRPVAVLKGTSIFYVHTDHLGTPRAITSGSTVVWRWESDPFGTTPAQEDPDGDGTAFIYNLRFAGQYFDAETGLHYNYFRTYDPSTGRYLESDPIGLNGGLNTYSYVHQNPLSYTDPTGEFVPQLVGALVGAGLEYFTNPCATLGDIALAGALGAVGGGFSKAAFLRFGPKSLTRVTGKEWSHSFSRSTTNRYTSGRLNSYLNRRGGINGSWVDPKRHYRHDPSRYPRGWRDMGRRFPAPVRAADRIPDWAKGSAASGAAGAAVAGSDCECSR